MRIVEFDTLNQIVEDIGSKLESDPANITIEENSISYRILHPNETISDTAPSIFYQSEFAKFNEMMVWETTEFIKEKNRIDRTIHLKVKNFENESSLISIKLNKLDTLRLSIIRFRLLLRKAKRLKVKFACQAFDRRLAAVNSDRIDEILLGGKVCQTSQNPPNQRDPKPSGNILPPAKK